MRDTYATDALNEVLLFPELPLDGLAALDGGTGEAGGGHEGQGVLHGLEVLEGKHLLGRQATRKQIFEAGEGGGLHLLHLLHLLLHLLLLEFLFELLGFFRG